MRLLNLVPIAALVVTAPAAAPLPASARPGGAEPATPAADADSICERYQRDFQGQRFGFGQLHGRRHGAPMPVLGAPPPPPPPPSPPPPAPPVAAPTDFAV